MPAPPALGVTAVPGARRCATVSQVPLVRHANRRLVHKGSHATQNRNHEERLLMNRNKALTGILAVLAFTATLVGVASANGAVAPPWGEVDLSSSPPASAGHTARSTGETTKERGYVIECTGIHRGQEAWVSLYENDTYTNVIQVVVGDDGTGVSREVKTGFVDHGDVRGSLRLKGRRLVVEGNANRVGPRIPVHEEHDDAGQHIVADGYHKALRTDLSMRWMKHTIALDCPNAFFFKLNVTKTDITNG